MPRIRGREELMFNTMKVLPLLSGIASLQKCYLPMKCFDDFGTYFNKYVTINHNSLSCIVKLNFIANLNDDYCHINAAVSSCSSNDAVYSWEIKASNIIPKDGSFAAKNAHISIVFENLEKLVAWKKKRNSLHVLADVLELYVVSSGMNIFLKDIEDHVNLGITYVTINHIDGRTSANEPVFKFVPTTKIIVDSELTEKMLQSKTPIYIGGMEKPFKYLVDVVKHRRLFRSSLISGNVLLVGPAGRGKRTLVKRVANACGALVIDINGSDILCPKDCQGRPGEVEANIKYTFELIRIFCEQLNERCRTFSKALAKNMISNSEKQSQHSTPIVILLLTHVELMCPSRKQGGGCQTTQLLGAIDSLQHLDNLLIFATSSAVDDVDQAIRRPGRLDNEMYIGVPSEVERYEIIKELLLDCEKTESVPQDNVLELARAAAALTPGRVPADLGLLCRQVKWMHLQKCLSGAGDTDPRKWLDDFAHCATKLPLSTLLGGPGTLINTSEDCTSTGDPLFSSIGGLPGVKERLLLSVQGPLLHAEAFRHLGVSPPTGVLLYGPPGCAKTTLARAVASAPAPASSSTTNHTITFLSSSAAELYSPFVGESEKTVMELFRRARAGAPSIVFIDELDALFGSRDGMVKGGVQERVLAALLVEMDGVGHRMIAPPLHIATDSASDQLMADSRGEECGDSWSKCLASAPVPSKSTMDPFSQVTVIAATNRPDLIDDALLRPGRLDQLIYVPPPDEEARFAILSYYTKKIPIEGGDKDLLLRELAKGTELYSGADLKNLCKEAALTAISEEGFQVTEVKKKYFEAVLKSMRSSLTPDMVMSYVKFNGNKCL